ncbi:Uncharacterised protein [Mycobacteroides abscessus subsp. abscessus]|nr:Uncharacterised protein [Mycobacteroides abscessus subsp. abscessus]
MPRSGSRQCRAASSAWFFRIGHNVAGICSRDLACTYTESSMVPQISC